MIGRSVFDRRKMGASVTRLREGFRKVGAVRSAPALEGLVAWRGPEDYWRFSGTEAIHGKY